MRIIIGKGGLRAGLADAFRELGGVYLAIIGGAAALETTWIEQIEDVDLDDLNPESLWRFRVQGFGPLLVSMDSHGGSLYDEVQRRRAGAPRRCARAPRRRRHERARCKRLQTDILILGSGGAGLFAALHAHQADPAI